MIRVRMELTAMGMDLRFERYVDAASLDPARTVRKRKPAFPRGRS